jgi:DNA-binding response OmpR family regulator
MAQRLLLADDSITIQKVVELVLAEEDFEIKAVNNGEEALNALESFKADIVLADIEMPKMNGYQLCEKIKQNPKTAAVPVILLAGAFEPIDEDLSRQVGADDSVIKPFESQELISKINAALTMASAEGVAAFAEPSDETIEIAEEAEEISASDEAVEVADLDEDLWAMEEMEGVSEEMPAVEETAEEVLPETQAEIELPEAELPKVAARATAGEEKSIPAAQPPAAATAVQMPSKEELLCIFEKAVDERISSFLSAVDIKEALLASLMPSLKDSIDKILWEIAPDIVEKMLRESLKASMASLSKEVERVIWETVPDLAGTMISKEIERIKSEF